MEWLHRICDIPSNPNGLCALSPNDNNPYLAYPQSSITGNLQIYDTIQLVSRIDHLKFARLLYIHVRISYRDRQS